MIESSKRRRGVAGPRWRVVALCALAAAMLPAGAADAGVTSPGVIGGGAMLAGDRDGSGNMLITLTVTPDARVRINTTMQLSCPGSDGTFVDATLRPVAVVAPDGAFRATGTRVQRFGPTELRTVYDIAGSITASGASGTATVSLHDNDPILPTCGNADVSSGAVAWQARRPIAAVGASGAIAPGLRYGITSPGVRGARGAIVLRVAPDGRAVDRVLHHSLLRCTRRVSSAPLSLDNDPWTSREQRMRIRPGGSFVERADLTLPFGRVISKVSTRFGATIGALGARGSYRFDARFVTPRTGRWRERCTTAGTIRWSAAP